MLLCLPSQCFIHLYTSSLMLDTVDLIGCSESVSKDVLLLFPLTPCHTVSTPLTSSRLSTWDVLSWTYRRPLGSSDSSLAPVSLHAPGSGCARRPVDARLTSTSLGTSPARLTKVSNLDRETMWGTRQAQIAALSRNGPTPLDNTELFGVNSPLL